MPRVVGFGRARRGEREQVGSRDIGDAAWGEQAPKVLEHARWVLDMLDRLQEHDRVEGRRLTEPLDHSALEGEVLAPVAQSRVLERFGVRVDADHAGGRTGQHFRAVALAAGRVEHPQARDPGADPLVDGEMAPVPVVLGRNVGERPLAGELERWHAWRLVALNVSVHWHGRQGNVRAAMEAARTPDDIRDVNTRYHDVAADSYDTKWGIDFGEIGQAQVLGKMRKLLGAELRRGYERSLEIGAGTGYFSLNLLQAGVVREATCTDISPGMLRTLGANAERLGMRVKTARADAESLPFADQSFDLVLGHAVLHHLPDLERAFAEFNRVLRPGGRIAFAGEPSRVGARIASIPKRGAHLLAPVWRAALRAGTPPPAPPGHNGGHGQEDHGLERFVDIHAFAPHDLSRRAKLAGFREVPV